MDKTVIKRIKITYGIFTSLLLVGLLCLAFCSLLLVYSSDNVAFAYGEVGDNLIFENDFIGLQSITGSGNVSNYWNVGQSNSTASWNSDTKTLTGTSSTGYVNLRYWLDDVPRDTDLTYMIDTTAHTGNWMFQIWYYSSKTGNPSQGPSTGWGDSTYKTGTFQLSSSYTYARMIIQCRTSITLNYVKLEVGSSFTGYVAKDYENYGYNQGVSVGSNSTAYINSGYILDKTVLLSDLENGSTFTINNINYRFQGSTVLDNYFQTNVINSWPLGANGDTNHRYLGFLIADDLYKFSAIQISIIRDVAGYLYYSGDGLTPKIVDLSSLSPVSSYPFNYLNQSTYMDTYVIYASEFTSVYYLTYIDTSSSTAGDTLFFNTINIYSNLDNSSWYDRGIETGKSLGFNEGYNKGYQEGSNYSGIPFYNMFGAIFDVPVQTINGLLDFNILGVNMKGFILGLISLCIILFILKIVFK